NRATSAMTGSNNSHLAFHSARQAAAGSNDFFWAFPRFCWLIPHQAVNNSINTPGSSPPANIFSMVTLLLAAVEAPRLAIAVPAMIEYRITGKQGGNSRPSEPAPVSRPKALFSE